jgi:hypothetical protein
MRYKIQPKYEVILIAGGIFAVTLIAQHFRLDMHHEHIHQDPYAYSQPMTPLTQASTVSGSEAIGFASNGMQVPSPDDREFKIFYQS